MAKILKKSLIVLMVFIFQTTSILAWYEDVVPQSLFYDAINHFSFETPILDQNKDTFKPLTPVTKAEFYKLVIASTGIELSQDSHEMPFLDISGDEWFATYINKALESELISFSENDPYFNPAENITRAEAIEKIINFYQLDVPSSTFQEYDYLDVNAEESYATISQIAYKLKLMHDHKSRTFYPEKKITRAEVVHVLYKVHKSGLGLPKINYLEPSFATGIESDITLQENFYIFLDVWERIINQYVENDDVNKDELIYGAISGMLAELDDPYSSFFNPKEATDYLETLEGTFEGIGIYLIIENEQVKIITPIKGSPADEAGINPNDIITEIDGIPTSGLSFVEVIDMIRGEPGTSIELKLKRENNIFVKNITRKTVDIPYVESEIQSGVGIIRYYQFTSNSHNQFVKEIDKVKSKNPKGLIIDLRNNPGGYLYSAKQFMSHFLIAEEDFLEIIFADGKKETHSSFGPGELKDYNIVVLINNGSASASEIIALCLQEKGIPIVGENSYGKNKIQGIFNYKDGSSLKLSTAKWATSQGSTINDQGITPDYDVKITEKDIRENLDPQLKKALSLIK